MFGNLWAFIKGALGGLLGCIAFVIIFGFGGMTFEDSQWLLYWFLAVAFFGGFITSAAENGYGIFSMILFVVVGVIGMHVFAIMGIVAIYNSGQSFNGLTISMLAVTGVLLLRWYKMIGEGSSDGPWLLAFLAIIIGMVAGYFLTEVIGEIWGLVVSAVVDGVCLIIMLVLRIRNGSALDY